MPIRRKIKNVVNKYSYAQIKVREATSNDHWGPSSTIMAEISNMTYSAMAFTDIMTMIWKRLNDKNKNWRHVYKSLVLLEYIVKTGSARVAQHCRQNIFIIQTLSDFQYVEENKDHGLNVREKAKHLVEILKDDDKLLVERTKALKAKERLQLSYPTDISPVDEKPPLENTHRTKDFPCKQEVHEISSNEEDIQLKMALAISIEEHEKEVKRKAEEDKMDDIKLRMAIEASRKESVSSMVWENNDDSSFQSVARTNKFENGISQSNNWLNFGQTQPPEDPWSTVHLSNSNSTAKMDDLERLGAYQVSSNRDDGFNWDLLQPQAKQNAQEQSSAALKNVGGFDKQIAFLGEHANLVSLDNLVSRPLSLNPFAITPVFRSGEVTFSNNSNLFETTQAPSKVSLNQLKQQRQMAASSGGDVNNFTAFDSFNANKRVLPQPLIPVVSDNKAIASSLAFQWNATTPSQTFVQQDSSNLLLL